MIIYYYNDIITAPKRRIIYQANTDSIRFLFLITSQSKVQFLSHHRGNNFHVNKFWGNLEKEQSTIKHHALGQKSWVGSC